MVRWIRSYWDEEDVTMVWEVGGDGWVTRSVELVGPERQIQTAAALDEVLNARDTGGSPAVVAYEARYGGLVDQPIEDWDFPHQDITLAEFEQLWAEARRTLEARS